VIIVDHEKLVMIVW